MATKRLFKLWWALLGATLVGVTICILWLDIPVAQVFLADANRATGVGAGLSSTVFVAAEMALMAGLAIARLMRSLPEFPKALFVACCASLLAFLANDYILKLIFGRQNPSVLLQGVPSHVFNFFKGDLHSSFPSGHMVMATAFAATMIRLQPRTLPVLVILLCIGGVTLIVGDWHFLGDIIAGAFVGGTAGLLVGELWLEHVQRYSLAQ